MAIIQVVLESKILVLGVSKVTNFLKILVRSCLSYGIANNGLN